MNTTQLLSISTQAGSFIAGFAAIAAGIIMMGVKKRFGTGILASGFNFIALGVLALAAGIILDVLQNYIQSASNSAIASFILLLKEFLFVVGTYLIAIGSKRTGDKLESLTK